MSLKQTPSQTAGPFFHYALTPEQSRYPNSGLATAAVAGPTVPGQRIKLVGSVIDGQGLVMADALIELWQADSLGRYAHPSDSRGSNVAFKGFGRCATDANGEYCFDTIKPGAIGDGQAPHITFIIFTRGGQNHLYTRVYFPDEAASNSSDPVLKAVPEDRRGTLIASKTETGYRLNIRVQGDGETVFFDV